MFIGKLLWVYAAVEGLMFAMLDHFEERFSGAHVSWGLGARGRLEASSPQIVSFPPVTLSLLRAARNSGGQPAKAPKNPLSPNYCAAGEVFWLGQLNWHGSTNFWRAKTNAHAQ